MDSETSVTSGVEGEVTLSTLKSREVSKAPLLSSMGTTLCASMLVFLSPTKSSVVERVFSSLSIVLACHWAHWFWGGVSHPQSKEKVPKVRQANPVLHEGGARRDPLKDNATEGERRGGLAQSHLAC